MSAKGQRGRQRNDNRYRGSPDWYTPAWLLAMVRDFLGEYTDPCPALHGDTLRQNGLLTRWQGRVYCNPPYGRDIVPWTEKAMTEPVEEIILLVPAYTDTRWFTPLFQHTICFVHGRVNFVKPDDPRGYKRAPHPSVLIYRGPRAEAFARKFSKIGPVMRQHYPMASAQPQLWEVAV